MTKRFGTMSHRIGAVNIPSDRQIAHPLTVVNGGVKQILEPAQIQQHKIVTEVESRFKKIESNLKCLRAEERTRTYQIRVHLLWISDNVEANLDNSIFKDESGKPFPSFYALLFGKFPKKEAAFLHAQFKAARLERDLKIPIGTLSEKMSRILYLRVYSSYAKKTDNKKTKFIHGNLKDEDALKVQQEIFALACQKANVNPKHQRDIREKLGRQHIWEAIAQLEAQQEGYVSQYKRRKSPQFDQTLLVQQCEGWLELFNWAIAFSLKKS